MARSRLVLSIDMLGMHNKKPVIFSGSSVSVTVLEESLSVRNISGYHTNYAKLGEMSLLRIRLLADTLYFLP